MSDIKNLQGPILVLGASGFVGANLLKLLLKERRDVYGTSTKPNPWRLSDINCGDNIFIIDLRIQENLFDLLDKLKPQTIFNCIAYGAYHFETDHEQIYDTNVLMPLRILDYLESKQFSAYIHAGSSSEYGDNSAGPLETDYPLPNSHYAVTKLSCANLIQYYGHKKKLPVANLRLYSVYGPLEDSSRLFPNLIHKALEKTYPPLVNENISRDFIYVDDVCQAFISAALNLKSENYGDSFNIGNAKEVTLKNLAFEVKDIFSLPQDPQFGTSEGRAWDNTQWFANNTKAKSQLNWEPKISLKEGIEKTSQWIQSLKNWDVFQKSSKKYLIDKVYSVSAIVACYKDNKAIPFMHKRLTDMFVTLGIDYEIIFVNDASPDNTEEVIAEISARDPHTIGITHSRNFGSQAAFLSGMAVAKKNACVLMDGDLQDPPEIIPQFVEKWREGFDVVYGVRVKREATWFMQIAYKLYYRIFDYLSYIHIPKDAGDFSLIDHKVMHWILKFPERDVFLRAIRAYIGFKQTGVPYLRPERMFGVSTNSLMKNFGWAKKGILSYSYFPLNFLTFSSIVIFFISLILGVSSALFKIFWPDLVPRGLTFLSLITIFFGSFILVSIAFLGEYIAKIFEEVKSRPKFIRKSFIKDGKVKNCVEEL